VKNYRKGEVRTQKIRTKTKNNAEIDKQKAE
jgi:hypothetical protein